ncbi:glycosyltransferase family 87 protein [Burkholderia ubonensis]|uniref:glycosyltransferase family 87 protein n=1 Tax=Burkholderia ubonensis TaxID=101571 RepID=UPI000A77CB4E|nr:glycosyltransferase family 87 protein [Burkholderia ubonensis]
MDATPQSMRRARRPVVAWLTPRRVIVYSIVMLVFSALFVTIWAWVAHAFPERVPPRVGADFSVFWTASYLMLHGSPAQAYDFSAFSRLSAARFDTLRHGAFAPWLYPPTYLLLVTPLALLPFAVGYPLFVALGVGVLGCAAWRVAGLGAVAGASRAGALALVAAPCVFVTAMFGQNAFLTAACAALAVCWADRRPAWAGLCIGLLSVKPQMALLFPFVLVAARAWRTFAWAALATTGFAALSVLVCGVESLRLFVASAGLARALILEHGIVFWFASPTPFAALRLAGVPLNPAYAAHAGVAAIAIAAACVAWAGTRDVRVRAAVLAVARRRAARAPPRRSTASRTPAPRDWTGAARADPAPRAKPALAAAACTR